MAWKTWHWENVITDRTNSQNMSIISIEFLKNALLNLLKDSLIPNEIALLK